MTSVVPAPDPIERLQRFSRFVGLIAEQLDAVRDCDTERLRRLRDQTRELERELTEDVSNETPATSLDDQKEHASGDPDALASLHAELEDALSSLEERFDADRWTEEQLTLLSNGALRSARTLPIMRLVGCTYPDLEQRTSRVDRRF